MIRLIFCCIVLLGMGLLYLWFADNYRTGCLFCWFVYPFIVVLLSPVFECGLEKIKKGLDF